MCSRVNTDVRLDPDFGQIVPPAESFYKVLVKPANKDKLSFEFFLLLPIITNPDTEKAAIEAAIECLFDQEEDDEYEAEGIADDDYKKVTKSTPIASFDPDDQQRFIWLMPPRQEMS